MSQADPGSMTIPWRLQPLIHQISLVVDDVDKTAEAYWNKLGIGPWLIQTLAPPDIYNLTYHENPADFSFRVGFASLGQIEFELMAPVHGPTVYGDFAEEHREGLQHLQYMLDSWEEIDKHEKMMKREGFRSAMAGHYGNKGYFNYVDTRSVLKTYWEIVKWPEEPFGGKDTIIFPAYKSAKSPANIKVEGISQVGFVVNNIEKVMENYWDLLGIGPWEVYEHVPPTIYERTYHGKAGDFLMRVAMARSGQVQIELVEPLSGNNIYSDFIDQHGENLHHVQFITDDINQTTKTMNEEGFATLMSGRVGDGAFAYYDTTATLKCIWEAHRPRTPIRPSKIYP